MLKITNLLFLCGYYYILSVVLLSMLQLIITSPI